MATSGDLRRHLGTLSSILWNYGATFAVPTLNRYGESEIGFAFAAELPGASQPKPPRIELTEVWAPERRGQYRLVEYAYDFIEYPLARRRAFHRHDPDRFAREFGVVVHEHCEEILGQPACDHYYGLPMDAYEAIGHFLSTWGQPAPLGCAKLRCMGEAA
jgi:hypothetical protein